MPADPPIVCTLTADALSGRIEEWVDLLEHAVCRRAIDDGVRVEFDGELPAGELMRLVAAEQACCQFLRFAITVDTRGIALEIRAASDARPLVEALFGAAPADQPDPGKALVKTATRDV
jgi:hypothetical protein